MDEQGFVRRRDDGSVDVLGYLLAARQVIRPADQAIITQAVETINQTLNRQEEQETKMSTTADKLAKALEARGQLNKLIHDLEVEQRQADAIAVQRERNNKLEEYNNLKYAARFTPYPDLYFRWSSASPNRIKLIFDPAFPKRGVYADGQSGSMIVDLLKRIALTHKQLDQPTSNGVYAMLYRQAKNGELPVNESHNAHMKHI